MESTPVSLPLFSMRLIDTPQKDDPKKTPDDSLEMVEGGSYDKPDDLDLARVGDDSITAEQEIL
jgi:hypothetical protein